jgi:hypothetical protein
MTNALNKRAPRIPFSKTLIALTVPKDTTARIRYKTNNPFPRQATKKRQNQPLKERLVPVITKPCDFENILA